MGAWMDGWMDGRRERENWRVRESERERQVDDVAKGETPVVVGALDQIRVYMGFQLFLNTAEGA
jgi:hypothetical protein